jgi:hypothetical protein
MKIVQKKTESVNKPTHKHCYVYQFLQKERYSVATHPVTYKLLTNITGHKHPDNRKWLEQGLRIAYGFMPKSVKYKYDKYQ